MKTSALVSFLCFYVSCCAGELPVLKVNTTQLLAALGKDVITKRSGLNEEKVSASNAHAEFSDDHCPLKCDMEIVELRRTVERLQLAYSSLCKELRHLSSHVLMHEYAFKHIASLHHVKDEEGKGTDNRDFGPSVPLVPHQGPSNSETLKTNSQALNSRTITRTKTSIQRRQQTINNGTHTIIHTSTQKIVNGKAMVPENDTEILSNVESASSKQQFEYLRQRSKRNVIELEPETDSVVLNLMPNKTNPFASYEPEQTNSSSVQEPSNNQQQRNLQNPILESGVDYGHNEQAFVNSLSGSAQAGVSSSNTTQTIAETHFSTRSPVQKPDEEPDERFINEVDVTVSTEGSKMQGPKTVPKTTFNHTASKKPEKPNIELIFGAEGEDFYSPEDRCENCCSVLHEPSFKSDAFQQKFNKWYRKLLQIEPLESATNRKNTKATAVGPSGPKTFIQEPESQAHQASIDKFSDEMETATDTEPMEYATCEVQPNRHISLILQEDVEGRINLWQSKYGGPVHMHIKLHGFRKHPELPKALLRAKRESTQILLEQEPEHQSLLSHPNVVYSRVHGFHVHEHGNLSKGCQSTGPHYNPNVMQHGGPMDDIRHVGDLGNIRCDDNGEIDAETAFPKISLFGEHSIIGRSLVIHAQPDDFGKHPENPASSSTGNSGAKIACCIIKKTETLQGKNSRSVIAPIRAPVPQHLHKETID